MLPSIELRIQNLVKALSQVVLPAIDPENALAREQAQLVIAHLQLIGQQWPKALPYEAQSFAALRALGDRLSVAANGGVRTLAAVALLRRTLNERVAELALDSLTAGSRALAAAIDGLIEAASEDGGPEFRARLDTAMLDYGAEQAWRERVWFAGAGLDPERGNLPSIDEMLAGAKP